MPARAAAASLAVCLPDSLYSDDEDECTPCGEAFAGEGGGASGMGMPAGIAAMAAQRSPGKGLRRTLSGPADAPCVAFCAFSSGPTSDEDGPSPARSGNNALLLAGADLPFDRTVSIDTW